MVSSVLYLVIIFGGKKSLIIFHITNSTVARMKLFICPVLHILIVARMITMPILIRISLNKQIIKTCNLRPI